MHKIKLVSEKNLFKKFVSVDELNFFIEDKQTDLRRYVVTRPNAAAILLYNKTKKSVVLIKQFRAPVFSHNQDGFILEVPAGVLEPGEDPKAGIIRETLEETGYSIKEPELLTVFYPSPGILNEEMYLYFAIVEDKDKVAKGGGLDSEKEFLEIVNVPVKTIMHYVFEGKIVDAKTMIGVFYLQNILRDKDPS
jgi:GDP-mannose pyrophosphatase NudK